MKSTVVNLRVSDAAGAPVADLARRGRNGTDPRQISAQLGISGQPMDEDWQGITLKSFNVALHPGLRRPPAAETRVTLRFVARAAVRLALWSCSTITAGMRAVARRRREGRMVARLERLDDVTLKDLGICRCEIEYLARTQASGKWRA